MGGYAAIPFMRGGPSALSDSFYIVNLWGVEGSITMSVNLGNPDSTRVHNFRDGAGGKKSNLRLLFSQHSDIVYAMEVRTKVPDIKGF